jgi:trk/ktr system potassium uptake protein
MRGLAFRHPARLVVGGFAALVGVGYGLLLLPFSRQSGVDVTRTDVFFTAVSAGCVTGLTVVDTGTTWSGFGQLVILLMAQVGGIGIMTLLSALVIVLRQRLGLVARALTRTESGAMSSGELRGVLRAVVLWSFAVEGILASVLVLRFWSHYDMAADTALWQGIFTSVMAFNNAGFGLSAESLMPYVSDWVVCVPIMVAVVIGGVGFPVLVELVGRVRKSDRRSQWSLHLRLTLLVSVVLIVAGAAVFALFEWTNPQTLGPLGPLDKLLASTFQSVSSRTAGFNTIDIGAMREDSWVFNNLLMFIGSGSASTGGGIKVSTFAVLVLAFFAEAKGSRHIAVWDRRIPDRVARQALSVTIISLGVVGLVATVLVGLNDVDLSKALFETTSAFGTVGMSTGITPLLSSVSKYALCALMFFGRVGPATLAAALALRQAHELTTFPEERPLVG